MTILGLAESFKTMNWPGPTVTLFESLFFEKYKDRHVKFGHNLLYYQSRLHESYV